MLEVNGKLLMRAYKLKVLKFKLDEDPLQCWTYFLTFMESLEMISSQYKETYDVLLGYPTVGGDHIKIISKRQLRLFLMQIWMSTLEV